MTLTEKQVEEIHVIIERHSTDVIDYDGATDDINAMLEAATVAETPASDQWLEWAKVFQSKLTSTPGVSDQGMWWASTAFPAFLADAVRAEAARASGAPTAREALEWIIREWAIFIKQLPNGEYEGLGMLRGSLRNAERVLAAASPAGEGSKPNVL